MEDKYKSYTVPDLAADELFILWVLGEENVQHWKQWILNNPDHAHSIEEARQVVLSLAALPVSSIEGTAKKELWYQIQSSINTKKNISHKTSFIPWTLAAAAAMALLIWVFSTLQVENVMADAGEKKEIVLPESSTVIINAGSRLTYHKNDFTEERELRLEGEAFFKVNPGSKFKVITDQGCITVLGTSFNVIARPGRFEVTCHTGKVKVEKNSGQQADIIAGEKIVADKNNFGKKEFTVSETPSWIQGKFTFEDQPLSVVIGELERQYNINVNLEPGIKDLRYTGLFESGNLDSALYMITWPFLLGYEIKETEVSISR